MNTAFANKGNLLRQAVAGTKSASVYKIGRALDASFADLKLWQGSDSFFRKLKDKPKQAIEGLFFSENKNSYEIILETISKHADELSEHAGENVMAIVVRIALHPIETRNVLIRNPKIGEQITNVYKTDIVPTNDSIDIGYFWEKILVVFKGDLKSLAEMSSQVPLFAGKFNNNTKGFLNSMLRAIGDIDLGKNANLVSDFPGIVKILHPYTKTADTETTSRVNAIIRSILKEVDEAGQMDDLLTSTDSITDDAVMSWLTTLIR